MPRLLERRSGLVVVVVAGDDGNAGDRLGSRGRVAVEGGIRGHRRSGRHTSAHHSGVGIVSRVGPSVRPRGSRRGDCGRFVSGLFQSGRVSRRRVNSLP